MNVKIVFLSAITMSLMGNGNGFFGAYATSVKEEFKPAGVKFFENGNGNSVRSSNQLVAANRTMTATQLEIFNKNGTRDYLKGILPLKGGGMFSKFFEITENMVDNVSSI